MQNEEDKYRKKEGRKVSAQEDDSRYLNKDALQDDLVSPEEAGEGDDSQIVSSENPENQEWETREEENKGHPQP